MFTKERMRSRFYRKGTIKFRLSMEEAGCCSEAATGAVL